MSNKSTKKYLSQVIAATMLGGIGIGAHAADAPLEFYIKDNKVTVDATDVVVASNGVAAAAEIPAVICGCPDLPDFSFVLEHRNFDAVTPVNGSVILRLGMVIQDQSQASRRIEASLGKVNVTVTNNIVDVQQLGTEPMVAIIKDGAATVEAEATVPAGIVSAAAVGDDTTVTITPQVLFDALSASSTLFAQIAADFDFNRHYTYAFVLQPLEASDEVFGHLGATDTYTEFPQLKASCNNQPAQANQFLNLDSSHLASSFASAFVIQGSLSVGVAAAGATQPTALADCVEAPEPEPEPAPEPEPEPAPEPEPEPAPEDVDVEDELADLEDTVDDVVIPTDGTVSEETVTQLNDLLDSSVTTANATAVQIATGTVTTTTALSVLTTLNTVLTKAGDASTVGGAVSTTTTTTSVTNMANVLNAIAAKGTTLDSTQILQISSLATSTVTNAVKFIKPELTNAQSDSLVTATSNLLNSALANGATLSPEMSAQAKALSTAAISNKLEKLAESLTGGVDLSKPEEVRALLQKPGVLTAMMQSTIVINSSQPLKSAEAKATMLMQNVPEATIESILASVADAVSNPAGVVGPNGTTAKDALANALFAAFSDGQALLAQHGLLIQAATDPLTVEVDDVTGALLVGNSSESYAAISTGSSLVTDAFADGIYYMADGRGLAVSDGFGVELAPMAADMLGFAALAESSGFGFNVRDDGSIELDVGSGEKFSGVFAYDNIAGHTGSCGAITVVDPTGSPASAGYAFGVNCANGIEQRVLPFISADGFYSAVLTYGLEATTDRNTGIVTVSTVGSFKPSFFVSPATSADTEYLTANGVGGIAVRASDLNGDGSIDFEIISADGVQALYGVQ